MRWVLEVPDHPQCDESSPVRGILELSDHYGFDRESTIEFFLVPLDNVWDTSKTNGKTPNDDGCIGLSFSEKMEEYEFRLLYKDETKLEAMLKMKKNNDESMVGCAIVFING
ncbi:hypothetical protein MTR67_025688 [Solanum verrucosum]|uniref:C-JID domain-containing protein n=1 Tax=Solanum verrucosum TaxID=315347 RepID=A0AAF0TZG9_SOLVR|nr:hypothetical protein MTR67_025688 [Solanum verrucosum]